METSRAKRLRRLMETGNICDRPWAFWFRTFTCLEHFISFLFDDTMELAIRVGWAV